MAVSVSQYAWSPPAWLNLGKICDEVVGAPVLRKNLIGVSAAEMGSGNQVLRTNVWIMLGSSWLIRGSEISLLDQHCKP